VSHIQKIRQRNTAETPLVILIKKHHETKKKEKKVKICALIALPVALPVATHISRPYEPKIAWGLRMPTPK
jgi:hypothetical protein